MSYWRELFLSLSVSNDTVDTVESFGKNEKPRAPKCQQSFRHCDDTMEKALPRHSGTTVSSPIVMQPSSTSADLAHSVYSVDNVTITNERRSSPEVFAPMAWWAGEQVVGEPSFDLPCAPRRGRTIRRGDLFLHFCLICGAWGAFGYGILGTSVGRWYCREHRP
jgi:hypothetical protein